MICYQDMTFCDHYRDCAKASMCHRPLTNEVRKAAQEWWLQGWSKPITEGAPISVFAEQPICHEPVGAPDDE